MPGRGEGVLFLGGGGVEWSTIKDNVVVVRTMHLRRGVGGQLFSFPFSARYLVSCFVAVCFVTTGL